jgi:hypothetical protein
MSIAIAACVMMLLSFFYGLWIGYDRSRDVINVLREDRDYWFELHRVTRDRAIELDPLDDADWWKDA